MYAAGGANDGSRHEGARAASCEQLHAIASCHGCSFKAGYKGPQSELGKLLVSQRAEFVAR